MKKFFKLIGLLALVCSIVYFIFIGCQQLSSKISKFWIIKSNLVEPFILTLTVVISFLGVLCSNYYADKRQRKQEAEWRKKLLEFEQKSSYKLSDMYVLLSFINPFSKEHNDSIDFEINKIISLMLDLEIEIYSELKNHVEINIVVDKVEVYFKEINEYKLKIYKKVFVNFKDNELLNEENLYNKSYDKEKAIKQMKEQIHKKKDEIYFGNLILLKELSHLLLKYNWEKG